MARPPRTTPPVIKEKITDVKKKLLHSNGFFFTLIRSSVSSQLCGAIDYIISFVAFSLFHLTPFLSTAIGAFIGGICNYIVNYRFTFQADEVKWRVALAKFGVVWLGSMLLNSFGTQFSYSLAMKWTWLHETTGISQDGIFIAMRLTIALIVSIAWNFLLQRNFVFHQTKLDPYIDRCLQWIGEKLKILHHKI